MKFNGDQIVAELKRWIRIELNNYADVLATGQVADWSAYQKIVGVIQGLALAERKILDLAEQDDEGEHGSSSVAGEDPS
jgi:hypothetical protein